MACPTCDHTIHGIGHGIWWCPRCGTLTGLVNGPSAVAPTLVAKCRAFETVITDPAHLNEWQRLGIRESIHLPPKPVERVAGRKSESKFG